MKKNCLPYLSITSLLASNCFLFSTPSLGQENNWGNPKDIANPVYSEGNLDHEITVTGIEIVGNKLIPEEVIFKQIKTRKGSAFSRRKISQDLRSINDLGYFDKDSLTAIPITKGSEGVLLKIQVIENSPITGLIIKGNNSIERNKIEEFLTPLVGMPRCGNQIKKAIEKIENVYHDEGYLLASVTELHFDPDGFLMVSIDEGEIAEVKFEGNTRTKDSYLNRITPTNLKPGQPYNEKNVALFLEGLNRTGFFKEVKREISIDPEDPQKHILTFNVEEQRTKSLSLGAGVGTLDGLFGNVNFTEPNVRGRGESLSIDFMAGTGLVTAFDGDDGGRFERRGDYRFTVGYTDPFLFGKDNLGGSINANASQFGNFIVDNSVNRTVGGGFSISRSLADKGHPNWSAQSGLNISRNDMISFGSNARDFLRDNLMEQEGKSLADAEAEARRIRDEQLEDGVFVDLTPSLVNRNIDETGTGWKTTYFGGPSIAITGDAGSYFSLGTDVRRYDRLTDKGVFFKNAFHAETQLGDSPAFRQLKAFGPYGARGYRQFSQVGYGNSLLSNTAELSIPFTIPKNPIKDTKLVLFNDVAWVLGADRINDLYDRRSFIVGFGAGLDVKIPFLGNLRVDYGIPLLRDSGSFFSGRFHINAGNQI